MSENEIILNGVVYVPKESTNEQKYVIIRSEKAGVFAGYLKKDEGDKVELINSRRVWYWEGAATLDQLAVDGTSKPDKCKFPCVVSRKKILGVIEIIPTTEKARISIQGVKVWSC